MTPILTRAQMRAFDRYAIQHCHVPGVVLMENAGRGAADVACKLMQQHGMKVQGARVVVVAGAGNNGGDGFVVARHLWARGADVQVFLVGALEGVYGDARINHDAYLDLGGQCAYVGKSTAIGDLEAALALADLVVDALFGTGLDRPLTDPHLTVIDAMNRASGRRLALDVPSGLDSDLGAPLGGCVEAHETVCFGHLKVGLLTPQGARYAGRVHVVDLGVPNTILSHVGHVAEVIERTDIASMLEARETDAHKYSVGSVLICAGSAGKSGAALLAARGAFRAGAGLVTVATWPEAIGAIDARMPEVMAFALDRDAPWASIEPALKGRKAMVVGPGFGLQEASKTVVRGLLATFHGTLVMDADALTLFRENLSVLADARAKLVLTPHAGEMARLLGTTSEAIERDRFGAVKTVVEQTGATVVLKGARTIVARPNERMSVNTSGNAVLATAGSGDVLAGMIGALSCSLEPFDAARAAVHLHGIVGDVLRSRMGDRGVFASELADEVPSVIAALMRGDTLENISS